VHSLLDNRNAKGTIQQSILQKVRSRYEIQERFLRREGEETMKKGIKHEQEDLTEREKSVLHALGEEPRTVSQVIHYLSTEDAVLKPGREYNTYLFREAIIGLLTKLEGKGYVLKIPSYGDEPTKWALTFKGVGA